MLEYQGGYARSAADALPTERAEFIRQTYLHLAGAVLAFIAIEAALLKSPLAEAMVNSILGSRFGWLMVLGAFMAVGWVADRWARSSHSVGMQYAGLGLYVVAEAIVFLPLLFIAARVAGPSIFVEAGIYTVLIFGGLTGTVFLTKKDFSFLRGILAVAGMAALGVIVVSILVGFSLGTLFTGAMIVFAAGYILYYTSNVLHHYPVGSHVAAALALFAAVALLFWYVLQLLMSRR